MGPAQAIRTGFAQSLQFAGRTSRSEFWWFAPVAIAPPVIAGSQISWFNFEPWGIWRVLMLIVLSVPLLAAVSRRLQDIGEPGEQAIYPFMPFVMLWIGYQMIYWFVLGTALSGLAGFAFIVGVTAFILLVPLYLLAMFFSVNLAASVVGHMLISSQPGPNRYGPNPLEVSP